MPADAGQSPGATVELSVIVPVFNEEEAVPLFLEAVPPILRDLGLGHEIIFIDDGSSDRTCAVVEAASRENPNVRLIQLSRNFGKEAAMTAGLEWAAGGAVIPMDVDLQDPPELIREFVRLWREGYDVVYGQRVSRESDTGTKRMSAGLFYRIFNKMSDTKIHPNVGDYRLMSRAAVDATLTLRERNRFMKGIFAWVGFPSIAVPYERPVRAAGTTKFNYWRLWNFALDGITSFSTIPLRIWTYVGLTVAVAAIIYMVTIILRTWMFGSDVPGYASLMVVLLLLGAIQLISLGVIGEYLSRLYVESKQRPIYYVQRSLGFPAHTPQETAPPPAGRARA